MFSTERLLYLELHKTGCSHIRKLLEETVGGSRIGKHNRPHVMPHDRKIVGSVRNPWDWYVSLWAFGCKKSGAVYGRVSKRFTVWYYRDGLMSEMSRVRWPAGAVLRTMWHDLLKPTARWRDVYSDPHDPVLFRRWLRLLYEPSRRFDVGEGFGFSSVSACAGLMTYRYLKLFSRDTSPLYSRRGPTTFGDLRAFDAAQNALHVTIRTESLESDLLDALAEAGYDLSVDQVHRIYTKRGHKTNPSEHLESSQYYDNDTTDLVHDRERLIIEKYGYEPPGVGRTAIS